MVEFDWLTAWVTGSLGASLSFNLHNLHIVQFGHINYTGKTVLPATQPPQRVNMQLLSHSHIDVVPEVGLYFGEKMPILDGVLLSRFAIYKLVCHKILKSE